VVEQRGGRYVREGRWPVPARIELRTQECRVTLDFTHAVITSDVLRIETDMVHGKLFIVSSPGIVIDTDGLNHTYSKLKLHSKNARCRSPSPHRARRKGPARESHRAAAVTSPPVP
jgi:hypothetical protein